MDERKNVSLLLLDAVMRVVSKKEIEVSAFESDNASSTITDSLPTTAIIHHYQMASEEISSMFITNDPIARVKNNETMFTSVYLKERLKVLSHIPGPQRRPPSDTDLNIYSMATETIVYNPSSIQPSRIDVPHVKGTFLLHNVLSAGECSQFIHMAETIGYSLDAVEGIDNIVLYGDDSLLHPIFERCRHLLPQKGLIGLNARLRFFRYAQGAVYRPHIGKLL